VCVVMLVGFLFCTQSRLNDLRKQRQGGAEKKLRVCDVCGSFLSIADSDK
jgi:hypothetical protein